MQFIDHDHAHAFSQDRLQLQKLVENPGICSKQASIPKWLQFNEYGSHTSFYVLLHSSCQPLTFIVPGIEHK